MDKGTKNLILGIVIGVLVVLVVVLAIKPSVPKVTGEVVAIGSSITKEPVQEEVISCESYEIEAYEEGYIRAQGDIINNIWTQIQKTGNAQLPMGENQVLLLVGEIREIQPVQ